MGKKIHLFFDSPEARKRTAILYSLLLSAKAQKPKESPPKPTCAISSSARPPRTTSGLHALTPATWAAAHKAKIATAAKQATAAEVA